MSKTQIEHNAKVEGGFIGAILPALATAGLATGLRTVKLLTKLVDQVLRIKRKSEEVVKDASKKIFTYIKMQRYSMPIHKFIHQSKRPPPASVKWLSHENLAHPEEPLYG
ncbi:hypothetical protein DPMN_022655 [Dreissena polymorpha]|uniref:Uncharacterized protein n=1 Tax=Dreissena polymorpha TaxID=45954 RepID=A0A9D4SAB0_DREPO|nr:hypothetical protein DPMN_022655 [Dreissena polymorpha]